MPRAAFADVGFTLHRGETLGLAGLVSAGRTEIAETIFGVRARDAGRVGLDGEDITELSAHAATRKGSVCAPEDGARHGAVLPISIAGNLTSGLLDRVWQRWALIEGGHEQQVAAAIVSPYRVRRPGDPLTSAICFPGRHHGPHDASHLVG